ncbi:universal stress protein [Spirosoma spitsbergense]|uniref:universal stress protein n=1 Tax=Spirosoma spitsbergense TaxID=431554 RepID=UPI000367B040|nr:universal stress protein [Spirosoma spitsbergense]
MYKILILTDFSSASNHTVAFTQALFADTATQFYLLHAFSTEPAEGFTGAFLPAEQRRLAEESLLKLERTITQQPVPSYHSYRTVAMLGSPVSTVDTLLAQEYFDLVVVGATGLGRTEFFGSVATGVVRFANTNVLVVPASSPIRQLERVVLATDYRSVNDAESFVFLTDLVRRKAAQLTILTIENPKQPDMKASELSHRYVLRAFDGPQIDTYSIQDEDVLRGINAYLDSHSVDLLVTLPHHKSVFDVLRKNSETRPLAYHPRVPLLALYDSPVPRE